MQEHGDLTALYVPIQLPGPEADPSANVTRGVIPDGSGPRTWAGRVSRGAQDPAIPVGAQGQ
jgi:hypothetical protein